MAETEMSMQSTKSEIIDSVSLLSWGANSYGQLGQGHREDQLSPIETSRSSVMGVSLPRLITGGGGHTLMIAGDGSLWVCGSNCHGQLGVGDRQDAQVWTQVSFSTPLKVRQVSGGWDFTVACSEGGDLYTWGSNAFHQLGRETAEKWSAVPERVDLPSGCVVVQVAAGLRHALALTADGSLYGWGQNKKGQVGHVTHEDGKLVKVIDRPVKLNIPTTGKISMVTAGAYHSGVVTDDQELFLWGCNKFGQLAQDPKTTSQTSQPSVLSSSHFGGRNIQHIVSGWTHNLLLADSGEVYSWGRGDYGQLGRRCEGSCDHSPKPVGGVHSVRQLVCGSEHCLLLTEAGKLMSWGWNEHGMCGTGDENNVPLPMQVVLPTEHTLLIGCGAGHCFAVIRR